MTLGGQSKKSLNLSLIARVFGAALLVPLFFLIFLALMTPITLSGALYLVGTGTVVIGIWGFTWKYARYRRFLGLGLGLIVIVAAVRLLLLNSDHRIKLLLLPEQNARCWLNCLLDEQDVALFSTRVLSFMGGISPTEQAGLPDAMYTHYRAMAKAQSIVPSPFARTYLKQQRPDAFDGVVIEPDSAQPVRVGVIFLHGSAGNFTMPCWLLASMVQGHQAVTVCPSVGWQGDWWTSGGEATLRATLAYLYGRGVNQIYLVGLSNGAVGASELAYKFSGELTGLILVSGASVEARNSGLPVLVLAGRRDERMPADSMRAYADRMGASATFVELPSADHFMLAKDTEAVQNAIDTWLRNH